MIFQLTSLCLLATHVAGSLSAQQFPVVHLPGLGSVQGTIGTSFFTHRTIYKFLGISYAKPPSGERRFKPPEEAGPWSGVYDATKMRQRCPQIELAYYPSPPPDELDTKSDIEDCLALNVFTPNINRNGSGMPVLFYIHGGSFIAGSAYDFLPDFLLEEDIILVVAQYRLGPLGFLSLKTRDIPGNMGMLDILLALRWVKTHIRQFGGDPSQVTVVGQSAGAAAASSLLVSPLVEKDLFSKMIIQSGSVLASWAIDDNAIESARSIAKLLGCPIDDTADTASCLKAVAPLDIVDGQWKHIHEDFKAGGRGIGGATLVVGDPNNFLDEHPRASFADGPKMRIPVMGGVTRDEGTTFLSMFYDIRKLRNITDERYLQRNLTRDMLQFFGYEDVGGLLNDAYQELFFRGTHQLSDMYPGLMDISGILEMKQSTYDLIRRMSHNGPAFAYSFNFYGGVSKLKATIPALEKEYPFPAGVIHSDELGYLFPLVNHRYTRRELKMVKIMTKLWTNFVKFGYPAAPDDDDDVNWPPMSAAYGPYLRITETPELRENFLDEFTIASREGFLSGGGHRQEMEEVSFVMITSAVLLRCVTGN